MYSPLVEKTKILTLGLGIPLGIIILAILFFPVIRERIERSVGGGGGGPDKVSYNVIGTPTNSSTLTALFSDTSKVIDAGYMDTLNLDIRYSPRGGGLGNNNFMEILVEGSNDDGVNYFPIGLTSDPVNVTSSIALYSTSTTGYPGIPLRFPGDGVSVGSTTYHTQVRIPIIADKIRISARERSTSTLFTGFAYIRATLKSN